MYMPILQHLQSFFEALRQEGIPVTTSQTRDCCKAILSIDWSHQSYFYAALFTTLVKDYSYQTAFNKIFNKFFRTNLNKIHLPQPMKHEEPSIESTMSGFTVGAGLPLGNEGSAHFSAGQKNPLEQDFSIMNLDDIKKLEALFPLISRRLAAKLVKKRKRNDMNALDFRRTIRNSMSTGGIPVNIYTVKRNKEKPVILTLCDVSGSVMNFSCLSLALIASLEIFFRQINSFAFIDEVDNITKSLSAGNPLNLRDYVLRNSQVVGTSGYTNYGYTFKTFMHRYSHYLTRKTTVLIFGDARNNWLEEEKWALAAIHNKVKKVYWFNPEPTALWGSGDSIIYRYQKYCDQTFSCSTVLDLEKALGQI